MVGLLCDREPRNLRDSSPIIGLLLGAGNHLFHVPLPCRTERFQAQWRLFATDVRDSHCQEIHTPMVAPSIDQLKRDWTDKYVVVDGGRPELARFRDIVGRVKTVNMSGRALVEFLDYHLNIGWYDIDLDFLKVVDKPPPKVEKAEKKPAKPAAKPPGESAAAPAAKPKPAAKPAGGKPSVADILAAARGGGAAAKAPAGEAKPAAEAKPKPAAPAKPPGGKLSTVDILAAARGGAAPAKEPAAAADAETASTATKPAPPPEKPAAPAPPQRTVEQMLAAARRGEKAIPPAPKAQAAAPAIKEAPSAPRAEEAVVEKKAPPAAATPAPAKSDEMVDRTKMSVAEKIAWCRSHDAK
jgi:hypothetical protein